MDNMEPINRQEPLKKHAYPLSIKAFAGIVLSLYVIALSYFLVVEFSSLRSYANTLGSANNYFFEKQYEIATYHYEQLLELQPNNKKVKLALAKSYFANSDIERQDIGEPCDVCYNWGMDKLNAIQLTKDEFNVLVTFVPKEFLEDFNKSFVWK